MVDANKFILELEKFPLAYTCLKNYVEWLCKQATANLEENDLIFFLQKQNSNNLQQLEKCLLKSQQLLGVSKQQFCSIFGFENDLKTIDPEKIHDILAEPLLVVDLDKFGFTQIEKLPRFIKHNNHRLPNADFLAQHKGFKFAIEIKTIRTENKPKPEIGKLTGNSMISSWWCTMFQNNIATKIEDKNQRVLSQLTNALKNYDCNYTMLVLYNRRLGSSGLMSYERYREIISHIHCKYKESIDFYMVKNYFGEIVLLYPELPDIVNQ
ncbi:MAG: hypothetical protein FVQ80_09455 [Planctomycetes bacterium]|nr:hypothetical protein [Planctomycetota bacterium]